MHWFEILFERLPSWLQVAAQMVLIGVLALTAWPPAATAESALAALLLVAGAAVGAAALVSNRPGNFNVRPELKAGARLAIGGIYRWVRHPMYSAVLLVTLGTVALDVRVWRALLWLALLVVLLTKARREERLLLQRFPQYAEYRARTRRFIPGLW
jgi:protein-S-isoprenylcysteine O-methyltransferase Ste14